MINRFAEMQKDRSKDNSTEFRRNRPVTLMLILALMVVSCNANQANASREDKPSEDLLLGLIGYNYTDRNISSYSVDGKSGGHVYMSSASSGGSGVTCCARIPKNGQGQMRVTIRWQFDGCTYTVSSPRTGATQESKYFYYKEISVAVEKSQQDKPVYLETHFYPGGAIKAKLTSHMSDPELTLDNRRVDHSSFPRCKNGEKPE